MYCKRMLLMFWLLSQALGFALPTLSSVPGQEAPLRVAWEQNQLGNHCYEGSSLPHVAYDAKLASVTMADRNILDIPRKANFGYDFTPASFFRKAEIVETHRPRLVGKAGFLAAEGGVPSALRAGQLAEGPALDAIGCIRVGNRV
jgi:hypothetical protein